MNVESEFPGKPKLSFTSVIRKLDLIHPFWLIDLIRTNLAKLKNHFVDFIHWL